MQELFAMPNNPLISVVICTYNRCSLLQGCLESLANQTLDKKEYEVIIVNNNSNDETQKIAECFVKIESNFKVIIEINQGASHARNRGWKEAHGKYVAYFDDDCIVPAQWLSFAKDIIDQEAPCVFGGPYKPFYNTPKVFWFKDIYGSSPERGNQARFLVRRENLNGGNISLSREVLEDIGGFDPNLGPIGQKMRYGEEMALQESIKRNKPNCLFYYDPNLYVYHTVRKEKMDIYNIFKINFSKGRSYYLREVLSGPIVHPNGFSSTLALIIQSLIKFLVQISLIVFLSLGGLFRNRNNYPFMQNYLIESVFPHVQKLGKYFEIFNFNVRSLIKSK